MDYEGQTGSLQATFLAFNIPKSVILNLSLEQGSETTFMCLARLKQTSLLAWSIYPPLDRRLSQPPSLSSSRTLEREGVGKKKDPGNEASPQPRPQGHLLDDFKNGGSS